MLFGYTLYVTYLFRIPDAWDVVIKQMLAFVGVFLIIWTLPAANRFVELSTGGTAPFWLWVSAMTLRGFAGFANFLVWYRSNVMESLLLPPTPKVGPGLRESVSLDLSDEEDEDTSFFAGSGGQYDSLEEAGKKPKGGKKNKKNRDSDDIGAADLAYADTHYVRKM